MARLVAVLDANVLYPARLRDLFLRLAIAGQYEARWSDRILDECFDNLTEDRPDLSPERLHRTRHLMGVAVPDALVAGYDHLVEQLRLPDPDDRHVLAAAIAAAADVIVTANVGDFPDAATSPHGIAVLTPDEFVLQLVEADVEALASVIEEQAASLSRPPMTTTELLDGLELVGLWRSVHTLRRYRQDLWMGFLGAASLRSVKLR